MLLSVAYFPPLSWFAALARDFTLSADRVIPSVVRLEACENYQKQSWRNRCRILTANGPENLLVPVVHEGGTFKLPITSIRIDYSEPWVTRTERAISSAYDTSPFFEHYRDDIFSILESRYERLWDLDLALIEYLLGKFGIAARICFTQDYSKDVPDDLREVIHPKRKDTVLEDLGLEKPYFQVFSCKYGFQPNLSAIDLLFNEGPASISFLKSGIQK